MKAGEFLSGIVYFFNDFVGAVIPGIVAIAGIYYFYSDIGIQIAALTELTESMQWLLVIVASYASGHALLSLHGLMHVYIKKPIIFISSLLTLRFFKVRWCPVRKIEWTWGAFWHLVLQDTKDQIIRSDVYKQFSKLIDTKADSNQRIEVDYFQSFNNLRSMAMTISKEGGETARRFRFISLFCFGIAMAIMVLGVVDIYASCSYEKLTLYFLVFFLFYTRGISFEFRALNIPFPVALSEILFNLEESGDEKEEKT